MNASLMRGGNGTFANILCQCKAQYIMLSFATRTKVEQTQIVTYQ